RLVITAAGPTGVQLLRPATSALRGKWEGKDETSDLATWLRILDALPKADRDLWRHWALREAERVVRASSGEIFAGAAALLVHVRLDGEAAQEPFRNLRVRAPSATFDCAAFRRQRLHNFRDF